MSAQTKTSKLKCAVIGAGVIGSAAAYFLAQRGAKVDLYDQFPLHHTQGSSHGATRLFRVAYFEHPDYVPLLQRSLTLWRVLEADSNDTLLHQTSLLMAGAPDGAVMTGMRKASDLHSLTLTPLNTDVAAQRFPLFAIPSNFETAIEQDAGFIRADLALKAFANGARTNGAVIIPETQVKGWGSSSTGIDVHLANLTARYDRLIITPGAWAPPLLGSIGAMVKPIRKTLSWVAPGQQKFALGSEFLPFGIELEDGRFFYGFPAVDPDGVKVAEHTGGVLVKEPNDAAPEALAKDAADIQAFLKQFAPGLPAEITRQQSCLYEMSPDGDFIIDRHPEDDRVCFAIGLSGHGFKFAPVIGEALAEMALNGEPLRELSFLSLQRFGGV